MKVIVRSFFLGLLSFCAISFSTHGLKTYAETLLNGDIIALKSCANNKIVSVGNDGAGLLVANSTTYGQNEQFQIVATEDGAFALKSLSTGKWVSADNGGFSPLTASLDESFSPCDWQEFEIQYITDKTIMLISRANGNYVSADNYGENPLVANCDFSGEPGIWERFEVLRNKLLTNEKLTVGDKLTSPDTTVTAILQGDGNFVVYKDGKALWAAFNEGKELSDWYEMVMQGDGHLVGYLNGSSYWESNQVRDIGVYTLELTDDGALCIVDGSGQAIWQSNAKELLIKQITAYANKFTGVPYVWGGTTPKGFDCSGFTQYVYAHFGFTIGRTTYDQVKVGIKVSQKDMKPGDLVFTGSGHVGIYIGDGKMIHSPHTGATVSISPIWSFYEARRIVN